MNCPECLSNELKECRSESFGMDEYFSQEWFECRVCRTKFDENEALSCDEVERIQARELVALRNSYGEAA